MAKSLYIYKNGNILYFKDLGLYLNKNLIVDFSPYVGSFKVFLSKFRVFNRLFRLDPRLAIVENDICLLSFLRRIFVISINDKKILSEIPVRRGFSNILNICSMSQNNETVFYWGDYGQNDKKEEIFIYRYTIQSGLEECYKFPKNTIKHIHNILYDIYRNQFVVFTGDLDEDVGIYIANKDFTEVTPFLVGDESYRAVVGYVLPEGLIWATDSVLKENYLYYYSFENNELKILATLGGSVIYGTKVNNGLAFATTVEPYPSKKSKILSLLDNRRAPSVKTNNVDLYFLSKKLILSKLASYSKDFLPMRLFQYGHISFPIYEDENEKTLYYNPVGVRKLDGTIVEKRLKA